MSAQQQQQEVKDTSSTMSSSSSENDYDEANARDKIKQNIINNTKLFPSVGLKDNLNINNINSNADDDESNEGDHTIKITFHTLLYVFVVSSMIKVLLMPAYHSTDFEVHRNWMAVTHSLPSYLWYRDKLPDPSPATSNNNNAGNQYELSKSQWTLDYPPLFAWFEKFLSLFAYYLVDENITKVSSIDYDTRATIIYQRCTVIISDIFLFFGTFLYTKTWPKETTIEIHFSLDKAIIVAGLVFFNPSLILVDHIHFQYNGFLLGILLISISMIRHGTIMSDYIGGILFAILLMFKHIFLYAAPLYFIYLLRHFCWKLPDAVYIPFFQSLRYFSIKRLFILGSSVAIVFAISIGSILIGDPHPIEGLLSFIHRLFPVQRGLMHAYWAPNFWALYTFIDKCLFIIIRWASPGSYIVTRALSMINEGDFSAMGSKVSATSGLVGVSDHLVLPSIPPLVTALLTFIAMLPALINIWKTPHPRSFLSALVYCMLCSFLFGYHVHEKAILMAVIPLTLTSCDSVMDAKLYLLLSWITHVSVAPLLFTSDVAALKPILFAAHVIASYISLDQFHINARRARRIRTDSGGGFGFRYSEKIYLVGLFAIYVFAELHPYIGMLIPGKGDSSGFFLFVLYHRFPFLPLLLTSVYCAIGVIYCWNMAWQQLGRKLIVIETYQPSPRVGAYEISKMDDFRAPNLNLS